jgi:starch phosphorylase
MASKKSSSTAKKTPAKKLPEASRAEYRRTRLQEIAEATIGNSEKTSRPLAQQILDHLQHTQARDPIGANPRDWWTSLSYAVRDRILERMIATQAVHNATNTRRVYYLSLEYLMGSLLSSNLHNTGLYDAAQQALRELGIPLQIVQEQEVDMGLGNGGLGRLAACFLDSLATLDLPAVGYGIHYEFGLFRQEISNGYQVEHPDAWLRNGTPWEIMRPEYQQEVGLFGHVETYHDHHGRTRHRWIPGKRLLGVPYDIPIAGYNTETVNFLRLWASRASEEFSLNEFNQGSYVEAVREKAMSETVSKVLYPNDKSENGKELRLTQQYFFVSCSLRDIIRRFRKHNTHWFDFPSKVAIQLNDTHPAVATVELMRILLDEENMPWDDAFNIVCKTFAYTNHTLMPEALERWSVPLFERMLPRHLQIIYEINARFLDDVEKRWPGDDRRKREMSIIEEGHVKQVRMAHLSVVCSHSVNGVAAIHSELLKTRLFPDFNAFYPGKFKNVTNGITPRRWLLSCNPRLSNLISTKVKGDWPKNLDLLRELEAFADNQQFQRDYLDAKHANKVDLSAYIHRTLGIEVNPDALFDVQIKRLHEYKRQHLNLLHIVALYRRLLENPALDIHPRVFLFGAKAAPGYDLAKNIIKAINSVGMRINNDSRIGDKLKVVFLPNYSVSLAARMIPAADLSEQISTAGTEASGTGNMKLALNGALTIGTLDGANIEIKEEVGDENIFIFGHTVEQVAEIRSRGYNPWDWYSGNQELRGTIEMLQSGYFTPGEPRDTLAPLCNSLLHGDPYMVFADYQMYADCQAKVDQAYRDRNAWARKAILNTARVGKFSSDRSIRDYARTIWKLDPTPVL